MTWNLETISWPSLEQRVSFITSNPHSCLLDSASEEHPDSQVTLLGLFPKWIVKFSPPNFLVQEDQKETSLTFSEGITWLHEKIDGWGMPKQKSLPFSGGAMGYLSYELGEFLHPNKNYLEKETKLPLLYFSFHQLYLILNHHSKQAHLLYSSEDPSLKKKWQNLLNTENPLPKISKQPRDHSFDSNFDQKTYQKLVEKILDHIQKGDCYQVNLSQQFKCSFSGSIEHFYLKLRTLSPAPFMALLKIPEGYIISNSPETFLKFDPPKVITRPIKGTRPRNADQNLDEQYKDELLKSKKDNSELLMITDLMRNDLGKISQSGSVGVDVLKQIESYSNVHHLVSTISSTLKEDFSPLNALLSAFPAGSITGAPKYKSMEIINKLEKIPRDIYTGSIGFLSSNGKAHFSVAIRTAFLENKQLFLGSGGGIVADSDPTEEYKETFHKAENFFKTYQSL